MRYLGILIVATAVGGCATQNQNVRVTPSEPTTPLLRESPSTKVVETRYEIRGYRDAESPGLRHDAHAIYRSTRVPARVDALETAPRIEFAPVSYAPLPANADLSAELSTQREITGELRAVQSRMLAIEQQAKQQYGTLVAQTAETVKLRQQLEAERARLQELETKLRERAAVAVAPVAPTTTGASAATVSEPKW